ncbi:ABC transporter ATP-binding protein [Rhabdothermincola salaria]|uniref:ABC transporter ATP-binding protein n=1 Tax=Rhabdothermincola salaria TaxID=2903142 RepID=UPI001E3A2C2F|nr:ABC transporter ATP-binding protein [Rhabdothermincola salaria]MCD9623717.1 ABC transporter ATP-binding protein [Rhabdothermincola salaria]
MTDHSPPAAPTGGTAPSGTVIADAVITATGVTRRFGAVTALDGATFAIGAGITGLLGANGAGKTTLMGLLLGLHRPDDGRLRVLGLDPTVAGPAVRARIGYSPEHHLLPPDTRAHDLVRHLAEIHGLPHREATARASDALWQVGLGEERFRPVGTMSTGQRQRVKLAQAIAHDPALVLLDEPTDGLDPVQRDEMLALIRRVGTEFGIHVVISSHLLEEVERTCDAAVILRAGQVVAAGPLTELTGQGRGVVVEVDASVDDVAARLRAAGLQVAVDGLRLMVTEADGSGPPGDVVIHDAVRDAVVAAGVGVRRLSDRTVRLEDVFLEVGA